MKFVSPIIILTGATDGIARNKSKGKALLEYIKTSNGNAKNVEIWEMDLADLQSVKNFAHKFIKEVGELHMLFNNAGYVGGIDIVKTKDGLEQQFQVNHLAPFLLTLLLLDTMKKSVSIELPGKIAFTSSGLQRIGLMEIKLMNIIVAKELSRVVQNENIKTYALHPGINKTNIKSGADFISSCIITALTYFIAAPVEQGAFNTLYSVLPPQNNDTG
ncbi:retinol dehydrogenase 12-like protein [Rhizophagus clarus]|uniref:Retinol dehydrogenase 12-like protein n=1 Tax=Rhizophagus clarus TaxID=94130 RepID=A0A8H3M9N8_9GLOM|nr:retinol dehydrogenase 12-like protein [Rhizophagus clarus]